MRIFEEIWKECWSRLFKEWSGWLTRIGSWTPSRLCSAEGALFALQCCRLLSRQLQQSTATVTVNTHTVALLVLLLLLLQVGEGEFGVVYRAQYLGTTVAVKVLKDTNVVALGDFRCELREVDVTGLYLAVWC
jgi:hypothetical protein